MAGPLPEPVHPAPASIREPLLFRLGRGLKSWLGLLTPFSYRVPVGVETVLGQKMLLVNDPAEIRRILIDQVDLFPKHPWTQWLLEPLIGDGIFAANGAEWKRQRRLLDPALQAAQLQQVFPQMQAACRALIGRLEAQVGETPVAVDAAMTLVAADVIVRAILSLPLSEREAEEIFTSFSAYQQRAGQALMLRILKVPRTFLKSYLAQHAKPIRAWITARVEERLQGLERQDDLLQALIDGGGFSSRELVDQVCVLFLAGHETSAGTLGMATYLLAQYPEVQARARQEVLAATLGGRRPLGFLDLRRLPYLQAVFEETLRLYPPLIFFSREAQAPTLIAGQTCPLRGVLSISPWTLHRHRAHWSQPDGFDPERFLSGPRQPTKEAYLPFGLGPRKCPGAAFAQQEALLVIGELLRYFLLEPVAGAVPELVGRLTLRSSNGLWVRLLRHDRPEAGNVTDD